MTKRYEHIKQGDVVWVLVDDETNKGLRLFVSVDYDNTGYPIKTAIN